MFAQLPEPLKQEVLHYLQLNDFPKAKAIHDAWLDSHRISTKRDIVKMPKIQL